MVEVMETVEVLRLVTDVVVVVEGDREVVETTVTGFAVLSATVVVAFWVVARDADVVGDLVVVVAVVVTAVVDLTIDGGGVVLEERGTTPHDAHGIDFVASAHVGVD